MVQTNNQNDKMQNINKVVSYFNEVDPLMYSLLKDVKIDLLKRNDNSHEYFIKLCREIIGQQLSGKAAGSIIKRFDFLFKNEKISAKDVLEITDQQLRDVGMAWAKVRAIKELADKTVSKELKFNLYSKMDEEEIKENLIIVKGIGPWTVEMFLIFTLGREDVFSIKDLGLKKAVCNIYELDRKDKKIDEKILKISSKWSPYRSYSSLALWKSLDLQGWWRK
jgi:DNA-3-methyladenine glycosylase II